VPAVIGILDYFFPPFENIAIEYRRGLLVEGVKPSQVCISDISIDINYLDICICKLSYKYYLI